MGFKDIFKPLDQPFENPIDNGIIKSGKIRVVIHYENQTTKTYKRKIKHNYHLDIAKRSYVIITDCIIYTDMSELHYYFNNPMPIKFSHTTSQIKSIDLNSPEKLAKMPKELREQLANTYIDATVLQCLINSNLISQMYPNNKMTAKQLLIIILIVIFVLGVITVVILQATGKIDLRTMFNKNSGQTGKTMFIIGGGYLWKKINKK